MTIAPSANTPGPSGHISSEPEGVSVDVARTFDESKMGLNNIINMHIKATSRCLIKNLPELQKTICRNYKTGISSILFELI
jgi:hypothetical protein